MSGQRIANAFRGDGFQNVECYDGGHFEIWVAESTHPLGVPGGGSGEMTTDEYYLLLTPLPAGPHTIHFQGTFGIFNFTLEITYYIDVKR